MLPILPAHHGMFGVSDRVLHGQIPPKTLCRQRLLILGAYVSARSVQEATPVDPKPRSARSDPGSVSASMNFAST